jgi:hypothetical protein
MEIETKSETTQVLSTNVLDPLSGIKDRWRIIAGETTRMIGKSQAISIACTRAVTTLLMPFSQPQLVPTTPGRDSYDLKGFLNSAFPSPSKNSRQELVAGNIMWLIAFHMKDDIKEYNRQRKELGDAGLCYVNVTIPNDSAFIKALAKWDKIFAEFTTVLKDGNTPGRQPNYTDTR